MTLQDYIGFTGVSILLLAYFLNLIKKSSSNSVGYILMNVVGAGLACFASVLIHYIPFIILEATWTMVSVISLIRILSKKEIA